MLAEFNTKSHSLHSVLDSLLPLCDWDSGILPTAMLCDACPGSHQAKHTRQTELWKMRDTRGTYMHSRFPVGTEIFLEWNAADPSVSCVL